MPEAIPLFGVGYFASERTALALVNFHVGVFVRDDGLFRFNAINAANDFELSAAVELVFSFATRNVVFAVVYIFSFTIASGNESVAVNAAVGEPAHDGFGPTLRESLVVVV